MRVSLLINVFAPHLKLHQTQNKIKLEVHLRVIRTRNLEEMVPKNYQFGKEKTYIGTLSHVVRRSAHLDSTLPSVSVSTEKHLPLVLLGSEAVDRGGARGAAGTPRHLHLGRSSSSPSCLRRRCAAPVGRRSSKEAEWRGHAKAGG
jgi:hypothetical protein